MYIPLTLGRRTMKMDCPRRMRFLTGAASCCVNTVTYESSRPAELRVNSASGAKRRNIVAKLEKKDNHPVMPRSDAASSVVKCPNTSELKTAGFRVHRQNAADRIRPRFIGRWQYAKDISICSLGRTAHCVKRGMTSYAVSRLKLNEHKAPVLFKSATNAAEAAA